MKKIFLFLLLSIFAVVKIEAQTNVRIFQYSTAPSGGCPYYYEAIDISTGDYYKCVNGTWTKIVSGGGAALGGSGTTATIPKFTATTTIGDSLFTDDGIAPYYDSQQIAKLSDIPTTEQQNVNRLVSGGGVAWTSGLSFVVAAATYEIGGVQYTSVQTIVTLDAADATNPRIDILILNDSGVATDLTGTPAADPAAPSVSPTSEIAINLVTIAAMATTPGNVTELEIYREDTEWTCTESDASTDCASTTDPRTDTKAVEGTTVARNDYFTLASTDTTLSNYNNLVFWIKSKATWANARSISVNWRLNDATVGNSVNLSKNTFGFDSSNTSTYQQIVIPVSSFGNIGLADEVRFTVVGSGATTIGFHIDDIVLQGMALIVNVPASNAIRSITYLSGCDTCDALADTNDQATFWRNNIARLTISEVWCESDGGTPTINLQRDDGSAADILSSVLTCTTSGATSVAFVSGEERIAVGDKLDFVMGTAGGTAKRITVNILARVD